MIRKNIGKSIKMLPARVAPYFRVRHVRGKGVHSPFAYGIVRSALIAGSGHRGKTGPVYTYLKLIGVRGRTAMQLQNLHNYCGYGSAVVYNAAGEDVFGSGDPVLRVFTRSCPTETIERVHREYSGEKGCMAVLAPRCEAARHRLCNRLSGQGDCISIDNRGFMLFFYGSGHTPRHYKL